MNIAATKKLEALNQRIASLQHAQQKVQDELATEFLNIIKHTEAFSVDFPTFVGGVLEIIDKIQSGKIKNGEWKKSGAKFIKGTSKTSKHKPSQKNPEEATSEASPADAGTTDAPAAPTPS